MISDVYPNKEAVMKQVSSLINFGKMTERRGLFSPKSYSPDSYDVKYHALEKHIRTPNLTASPNRKPDQGPCYMNSLTSRIGVEEKSWKSLEMTAKLDYSSIDTSRKQLRRSKPRELIELGLVDSFFA